MQLVLSLYPGIDLLGRAFEAAGFCIVRGPDLIWGCSIETFNAPAGKFDGIIAGSPCQDFSQARRAAATGDGEEQLRQFLRIVKEARPEWWLLENVPHVPDLRLEGYGVQRFDLRASECGARQSRLRHFQFGSRSGRVLEIQRIPRHPSARAGGTLAPCVLASEARRPGRRSFADFCELQGLSRDFDLPGWSLAAKYRAVGNGVPLQMGAVIAAAIRDATRARKPRKVTDVTFCVCGCGRVLEGRRETATDACRKRRERANKTPRPVITI